MRTDILILGQGVAGTMLGWAFESAGIPFAIMDPGHELAASAVAAGIVNPITGRRLVKSRRVDLLLDTARATYHELGNVVGAPLWHDVRIRRLFADARERALFARKAAAGELAPFAGAGDDDGFWIESAGRVDLPLLLKRMRERWLAQGRLRAAAGNAVMETGRHDLVIDCTGLAAARSAVWSGVPWEFSRGELVEIATPDLAPGIVLNRGHWVLPVSPGRAWVGATHEPGVFDPILTAPARTTLERSARDLLARPLEITAQRAGIRVNLPDKHPIAGRHRDIPRLGLINGLGAKGVLLAPWLARQWVNHLNEGVGFDPEIAMTRFPAPAPS